MGTTGGGSSGLRMHEPTAWGDAGRHGAVMIDTPAPSFGRGFNAHRFAIYVMLRLLPQPWARRAVATVGASIVNVQQWATPALRLCSMAPLRQLHEHGFVELDPLLGLGEIADIRAFLAWHPARVGNEDRLVDESTRGVQRGVLSACDHPGMPAHPRPGQQPRSSSISRQAISAGTPTISDTWGIHWSYPGDWHPTSVQVLPPRSGALALHQVLRLPDRRRHGQRCAPLPARIAPDPRAASASRTTRTRKSRKVSVKGLGAHRHRQAGHQLRRGHLGHSPRHLRP